MSQEHTNLLIVFKDTIFCYVLRSGCRLFFLFVRCDFWPCLVQGVQCQISSSILTAITSSSISPQTTRWSNMLCKHDCFNMLQGSSVFDLHTFDLMMFFWIRSIRHDQTDDVKLFCWACSSLVPQKLLFPTSSSKVLDVFFSTEVQVANVLTKDCCGPIL